MNDGFMDVRTHQTGQFKMFRALKASKAVFQTRTSKDVAFAFSVSVDQPLAPGSEWQL